MIEAEEGSNAGEVEAARIEGDPGSFGRSSQSLNRTMQVGHGAGYT